MKTSTKIQSKNNFTEKTTKLVFLVSILLFSTACSSKPLNEFQSFEYKEAIRAFQEQQHDTPGVWTCSYTENSKVRPSTNAESLLVEVDEKYIYVKHNNQITELSLTTRDNEKSTYKNKQEGLSLKINIINKKYSFKSVTIDQSKGFIFTTQEGEVLSPTDLSSGEQHELVILCELLFKVKPNTLILIDKPEMSLHISWQQEFLKDLQEITKLSGLDILMATHSPDIINDRWDLTVELEKPKQKSKDERTDNT